jgi:hypothetical protein
MIDEYGNGSGSSSGSGKLILLLDDVLGLLVK